MGLFNLFKSKEEKQRLKELRFDVDILLSEINNSLKLAASADSLDVRMINHRLANEKLQEIKILARNNPEIKLTGLNRVESDLSILETELKEFAFKYAYNCSQKAKELEKKGSIYPAIKLYWEAAELGTNAPFVYRRLAILYRKLGEVQKEMDAIDLALKNVDEHNAKHYQFFIDRKEKLLEKS